MKIALFTGTALRHLYYAAKIASSADVVLHVKTMRSQDLADEISGDAFSASDRALLKTHSDLRSAKEREYFLPLAESMPDVPVAIEVAMKELNSQKIVNALQESHAEAVIVYGTGLLKSPLLSIAPRWVINLHAGLSPYYRGAATLYWPIYFMEPQSVGFTLHLIDEHIDSGPIIHQNRPEIRAKDTIHDLGCRTITVAADDMLKLLPKIERGEIEPKPQLSKGKIFYERDFKPYHLRVTDFLMRERLFEEYLKNRHLFPDPSLVQYL